MNPSFDPYVEWLRIANTVRPPNVYELLGLSLFEDDVARIETAFHDRYAKVRAYQVGARSNDALRILDELSRAYQLLGDPSQRHEYDQRLSATANSLLIAGEPPIGDKTKWDNIEQKLGAVRQQANLAEVQKLEEAAASIDRRTGAVRFAKMAMRHGISSKHLRAVMQDYAARFRLAICGHCFEFLKPPIPSGYTTVKIAKDGSVVSPKLTVRFEKNAFGNRASIESSDEELAKTRTVFTFRRDGAVQAAAIATVIGLVLATIMGLLAQLPLGIIVGVVLGAGLLSGIVAWFRVRPRFHSALDAAWSEVVDTWSSRSPMKKEIEFTVGLSIVSIGKGAVERRETVTKLLNGWQALVPQGTCHYEHFARLFQLAIADAFSDEGNRVRAVQLLVGLFKECLGGRLPFRAFEIAARKGALWKGVPRSICSICRLHFLWSCVEKNLSVADVLNLIEHSPSLRPLFADHIAKDRGLIGQHLAVLRKGSWRAIGIRSAFELAAGGDYSLFSDHPESLLVSNDQTLLITATGLTFRKVRIKDVPSPVIRSLSPGFELELNGQRYEYDRDPSELVTFLKKVCTWYFEVFPREIQQETSAPSTNHLPKTLFGDPVRCERCQKTVPFVVGEFAGQKQ